MLLSTTNQARRRIHWRQSHSIRLCDSQYHFRNEECSWGTYFPWAVSPESMTASAPSRTAMAMSDTSARVGVGCVIMLSSMLVATITGFPMARHDRIISPCSSRFQWACTHDIHAIIDVYTYVFAMIIAISSSKWDDELQEIKFYEFQVLAIQILHPQALSITIRAAVHITYLQKRDFLNWQLSSKISSSNHSLHETRICIWVSFESLWWINNTRISCQINHAICKRRKCSELISAESSSPWTRTRVSKTYTISSIQNRLQIRDGISTFNLHDHMNVGWLFWSTHITSKSG